MSKKIKILHIIPSLGMGGAERNLIDLCETLLSYPDVDFKIALLSNTIDFNVERLRDKIEILEIPNYSIRKKVVFESYVRLVDEYQPDVIHTHLFMAEFVSATYVKPTIKYFCHGHDKMPQFNYGSLASVRSKYDLLRWFEMRLLKKKYRTVPTVFLANSIDTFNFFNTYKYGQSKVLMVNCLFDFDRFNAVFRERNFDQDVIRILNVGSFQAKKNQAFLVDIAKELSAQNVSFEITLVGDGEHRGSVASKATEANLTPNFQFVGKQTATENYYKEASVYLHTAFYEPFGIVFLEAMAAGVPIISLDGEGNTYLLKDKENSIVIKHQDPKAFVDAILFLIHHKTTTNQFIHKGLEDARKFDKNEVVKELLNFYRA